MADRTTSNGNGNGNGTMQRTERIRREGGPGMGMGGAVGEKASSFGPSLRRLIQRLRPHAIRVTIVVIAAVASVWLATLGPRVLGTATDVIFEGVVGSQLPSGVTQEQAVEMLRSQGETEIADMLEAMENVVPGEGVDFGALGEILLIVVGLYVGSALLSFASGYVLNDVVQLTIFRLREEVEDKLNRLPLSYFDKQPRGELLSRVTNDIDNVAQVLQQTMSQLLTSLLTIAFVVWMMFRISPTLAMVALVIIPVAAVAAGLIMRRSQTQFIEQWRRTGTLNSHIEETFTGHSLVKVFGRHDEAQERFEVENDALYESSYRAQFLSGMIMPIMMFVGNLNYVVIAVLGALRVTSGSMSLGDVQAFIQYSRQFTQPITQVASMANLLQSGVASAERVFELLDAEEETDESHLSASFDDPHGKVEFDGVDFAYEPDQDLIADLSLTVRPGQTVAIVGPTGAGKTTLVNLIMRFYELDGGRILLDDIDTTTVSRQNLRSQIGMVLQDTWLFRGSIKDNIAYGKPDATDEEILAAARATYVDRFVHNLPDGYDTIIDDEGSNVSAGEKQLITIARAFLAQPALLILDEATSSVDTRTELLVQQAMAALRTNRTSFVIAHRLSTIRDADLILVMEDGRIVERGTHDELLATNGAYSRLYNAQFEGVAT